MKSIYLNLDRKTKVLQIVRSKDNIILEIDEAGNTTITEEMLQEREKLPVELFEDDLINILELTYEQQIALYDYWGVTSAIMVKRTANAIKVDVATTKQIIALAESYKLLLSGWNSTYKIRDSIVRDRWAEHAKIMIKESKPEKDMSVTGILDRYAEQAKVLGLKGFEDHAKEKGGMIVKHKSEHESEDVILEEETIEVIPEEPIKKVPKINIEAMKQDLKDMEELKEQMRSGTIAETIKCNEHMLNDKIKTLKVEIINAEMQLKQSSHRGVPTARPGIINITIAGQKPILSLPQKKEILSKEKPAQGKGVRKKK